DHDRGPRSRGGPGRLAGGADPGSPPGGPSDPPRPGRRARRAGAGRGGLHRVAAPAAATGLHPGPAAGRLQRDGALRRHQRRLHDRPQPVPGTAAADQPGGVHPAVHLDGVQPVPAGRPGRRLHLLAERRPGVDLAVHRPLRRREGRRGRLRGGDRRPHRLRRPHRALLRCRGLGSGGGDGDQPTAGGARAGGVPAGARGRAEPLCAARAEVEQHRDLAVPLRDRTRGLRPDAGAAADERHERPAAVHPAGSRRPL
ncbi:MAG: hypothetical protein AVDCRST_MAG61-231, partial [uncultured Friedmanniella sp.]